MLRSTVIRAVAALPLLFAGVGHGLACNGDKVLFEDDFSFHDSSWSGPDQRFNIKDGAATIMPNINRSYIALNSGFLFDDVDVCATVTAVDISKPPEAGAGITFWAKDYSNIYVFMIASNGFYKIARMSSGDWVSNSPVAWTQSDVVLQGMNQPNKLRLTIKGQVITGEINGKQVAKLRAQSPGAPSEIGLYAESSDKIDTWKFTDFKATNVK